MVSYEQLWVPSAAKLYENIQTANSRGLLIVGSVGRAAIFNKLAGDSLLEIRERGETPLESYYTRHRGRPRDIDVLGGDITEEESEASYPHHLDARAFFNIRRRIEHKNGWRVRRASWGDTWVTTELDAELFTPVSARTVCDIPCITVRPALHYLLLNNPSGQRPNDHLAQSLLWKAMPPEERDLLASPPTVRC